MMMSLFSMFDPSANFSLQTNWMFMILSILLLPPLYWCKKSRINNVVTMILNVLSKEFSSLFSNNILMRGSILISMSLFLFIMFNNLTSNFPYTFCCSAHMVFSISLSVPIWLSIIIFYWTNLTKTMLSHLVPMGTPPVLMPLMVMIELTSNIIRPLALSVRLSANLIAGHLLMALLGNTLNLDGFIWPLVVLLQTGFMFFELMVAIIQSYVFSVLMTLYSSEIS
uniref:ATP synthase subunit a n=1 Tax=Anoeconeossa unicornuta TaxID=2218011 RepID=A0A344A244_9HEMI|nr:ATP synthase F0 subunit 6 [Anoeconeossa unicornuta]AWU48835.1 ATP synthase F0 subunit 6 [Anoeconeossa unicornuta]